MIFPWARFTPPLFEPPFYFWIHPHLYHASYLQQRQLSAVFFSDFFQNLESFLLLPRHLAPGKPQGEMERLLKMWPKDSSGGRLFKAPPTMVFNALQCQSSQRNNVFKSTALKRRDCINWYIDKAFQCFAIMDQTNRVFRT